MRISKKGVWRIVGLLAVGVLVHAQAPWTLLEASRNPSDCIKSCNNARDLCRAECVVTCSLAFPPGTEQDSCLESCEKICLDEMHECKLKCAVLRGPPSPTDP